LAVKELATVDTGSTGGPAGHAMKRPLDAVRSLLSLLWLPAAIYVVLRVAQLGLLKWKISWPGHPGENGVRAHLREWDSIWFIRTAEHGYPHQLLWTGGFLHQTELPFFPLYPGLIWVAHEITRLPFDVSAYLVSTAAGGVAALLLFLLGRDLYDDRAGYALLVLFSAQPMSIVLSMAYSEALFTAFVIAMLLALRRGLWLTAGVCCLLAGLTRVTGLAATATLGLTALYALWKMWRRQRGAGLGDENGQIWDRPVAWWRPVLATVIGAAGVPAFIIWMGLRVGRLDAYFLIQDKAWDTRYDGGVATTKAIYHILRGDAWWTPGGDPGWTDLSLSLLIMLAVVLTVVAFFERVWAPLLMYGAIILAMTIASDGIFTVKARYMVPTLVVLVPLALALCRTRRRTAIAVLTVYALAGIWYGAHELALVQVIV
jgi:Mannosyltransferase (PIG-V)